ncbi:hypothetical protein LZ086_17920 [Acinetobacter johnsonii]|nr:hypothetical protein LZ086_17920 [Acinetobacter johnsonii]
MDIKPDPRSVDHLIRDWRHRTLTLLTQAGVTEATDIIEKSQLLEAYFLMEISKTLKHKIVKHSYF